MKRKLIDFLMWFAGNEIMSNEKEIEEIVDIYLSDETSDTSALNTGVVRLSLSDAKINEAVEYWIDTDNIRIDSNGKGFGYHYKEGILKAIDLLNET